MSGPERREQLTARIAADTGITEGMIEQLVRAFYARIRADAMLGPIFAARIADWEPHLRQMFAFWSSVTLMTGRYKGRPVPAHVGLPGIGPEMFARWLGLFRATAQEQCPPAAAALFISSAERIAASLQMAIDFHRDVMPAPPPARPAATEGATP